MAALLVPVHVAILGIAFAAGWLPDDAFSYQRIHRLANNPLANGGWIQNGEHPLKQYDELTRSRLGYQWAKEWIRANPDKFLLLSLKKQVLFLGDDAVGFYETLKRGLGIGGEPYALAKLGANAFWIGLWALVLTVFLLRWPTDWHRRPEVLLFLLTILYFWAIDSVFESGARHHMPLAGLLAILAASLAEALPAAARER